MDEGTGRDLSLLTANVGNSNVRKNLPKFAVRNNGGREGREGGGEGLDRGENKM